MNNDAYRRRLERDLEAWRAAGHVSAEGAAAILASVGPASARISAATALGLAGAGLLGAAIIAFVMANWDGLPRFGRLALVLTLLAATIIGAIAVDQRKPRLQSGLLMLAALIFPAGLGLVGQMYNLPGEPAGLFAVAAAGAIALAYAGRSAAPAIIAAGFGILAYVSQRHTSPPTLGGDDLGLLALLAALAGLAWIQRGRALIHVTLWFASFALMALLWTLLDGMDDGFAIAAAFASVIWGAVAVWGRHAPRAGAKTLYGYGVWFGLIAFWVWGYAASVGIGHRALALALGLALLTLGRTDRHGWVLGAGVAGTLAAVAAVLADLGLDLMVAAGLFGVFALIAIGWAFVLSRRDRPGAAA